MDDYASLVSLSLEILAENVRPGSAELAEIIRDGSWSKLKDFDPLAYATNAEDYYTLQQVRKFFVKNKDIPSSGLDPQKKALETWLDCEKRCAHTNARIRAFREQVAGGSLLHDDLRIVEFLNGVKRELSKMLRWAPHVHYLRGRLGKRATYDMKAPLTTALDKLQTLPAFTQAGKEAYSLDWEGTLWAVAARNHDGLGPLGHSYACNDDSLPITRGNRLSFVRKTIFTDRPICPEPAGNMWYQLALAQDLNVRMRECWGLDLRKAQLHHREMAKYGSRWNSVATEDQSSASDCVALELVRFLLEDECSDWLDHFERLRSPFTLFQGKWYKQEKFSAMGNGYTFELETAIFHAVARQCCRVHGFNPREMVNIGFLSQYGDDAIVPVEVSRTFRAVLSWMGFVVNSSKSFNDGPFRESCGGDYFDGVEVGCHTIEEIPDAPEKWISLANGMWRVIRSDIHAPGRFKCFERVWRWALSKLPSHVRRLKGPSLYGDSVIHSFPADVAKARVLTDGGYELYWGYLPVARTLPLHHWSAGAQLAYAIQGGRSAGVTDMGQPVCGYRIRLLGRPPRSKIERKNGGLVVRLPSVSLA